jgi:predicted membrane-bound mannosyltransferase
MIPPRIQKRGAVALAGVRTPVAWGVIWGCLQAASPFAFFWLDTAAVYAMGLTLIAAVYIGFAVADGRPTIIATETVIAAAFVVVAAAAATGPAWLIVVGLAAHGLKDLWQQHTGFVANTRWWPPFCASVDLVAAALIAVAIVAHVGLGW